MMQIQLNGSRVRRWMQRGRYAALSMLVILLPLVPASMAPRSAEPIVVGDGTAESCTYLAFYQALAEVPAGGTIRFNCGPGPVTIWVDEVGIERDLTIDGGGRVTFSGGSYLGDMFWTGAGVTVRFMNLTIAEAEGACSGPIYNNGTLSLQHVTLANNVAGHGCGSGAIFNAGTLAIEDSLITGNFGGCDPVQCGPGGGIGNAGTLYIRNSTISGNSALGYGGGISNSGTATIENSTIRGNSSLCGTIGWDEFELCFPGGGIQNSGTMTIVNSTISGNAAGSTGGGIDNTGTLILQNTTLAGNTAKSSGGLANRSAATLQNSLLAGNTDSSGQPSDCSGVLISQGYNLVQGLGGCTLSGDAPGDLLAVDPLLGPLQDNGGPTLTHSLLPGSPAMDAGHPSAPGSGGTACEAADQRGVERPQNGRCDLGAVEVDLSFLTVAIDIKPGESTNPINTKSKGMIPVAILSSPAFDAAIVDPASVRFAPGAAPSVRSSLEDINRDGRLDLVLHFRTQMTGLQAGSAQFCLTGRTSGGTPIQGCETVRTVP